jgi:hypothetical protein
VVVLMTALAVSFVMLVIATVWYVVKRAPDAGLVTKRDFDAAYDDLDPPHQAKTGDRASAWRDFHEWQMKGEEERRSWEEPDDP